MGIIIKQSVRNSIYSYIGIAVGAFYTIFIIPKIFHESPQEWGIIQLLSSYVLLFMPFALLGFPYIIVKYWPTYTSDEEKKKFTSFLFLLVCIGMLFTSAVLFIFKKPIFFSKNDVSQLTETYYLYFFIIFILHTLFYFFFHYSRVFFKTTLPTFLNDTFLKLWAFILILTYGFNYISYDVFFKLYFLGFLVQLVFIFLYVKSFTSFKVSFSFRFHENKSQLIKILTYGFFSLLAGGVTILVTRIDLVMINKFLDLDSVAYYSIALFFITVLQVPLKSLNAIAVPIISENLNKDNHENVKDIYHKTSLNLFLTSSFILLIIFMNVNEFMVLLGEKFGQIQYVIIILGIAKLYEIINGLNYSIIIISKYYRYEIIFQIILLSLTIVTNIIFIPIYGIEGAALATAITIITSATIRGIFIYIKYGLQPYSTAFIKVIILICTSVLATLFISPSLHVLVIIAIKSIIIVLVYIVLTLTLNISSDFKNLMNLALKKLGIIKGK